ncbi:hypothetical protein INR49_000499 [Caranx melampygus]|nr:hypothetical protein INR49_000499 [Caranx melampygus]
MSSCYSANQYDSAFRSQRLQNWCETKRFKELSSKSASSTTTTMDERSSGEDWEKRDCNARKKKTSTGKKTETLPLILRRGGYNILSVSCPPGSCPDGARCKGVSASPEVAVLLYQPVCNSSPNMSVLWGVSGEFFSRPGSSCQTHFLAQEEEAFSLKDPSLQPQAFKLLRAERRQEGQSEGGCDAGRQHISGGVCTLSGIV